LVEENYGEIAGIRSGTLKIDGLNAYGWLKSEIGIHRLVRISPFDSNARRHTSFASIFVFPSDSSSVSEINPKDLRIDTYRASVPGGQHVNKTDSAVRITHIPSGIVVKSQTERSQHKNREFCMEMLKARLLSAELSRKEKENQTAREVIKENSFGNQIRSYVLQPYKLVKDNRTLVETLNVESVLDGEEELDRFMKAMLVKMI
jgi:peptide chain release factor 2